MPPMDTLPHDRDELMAILRRADALMARLIEHAADLIEDPREPQLALRAEGLEDSMEKFPHHVGMVIHEGVRADGRAVIDAFLEDAPADSLDERDRAMVAAWRRSVINVFFIQGKGPTHLDTRGVVDDLPYRIHANRLDQAFIDDLPARGFMLGRVAPLGDAWLMCGVPRYRPLHEAMEACAHAAKLSAARPEVFFRNPLHLELGLRRDRSLHDEIVARRGVSWYVGAPEEVRGFMTEVSDATSPRKTDGAWQLDDELESEQSVTVLADPTWGLFIMPTPVELMEALDDPPLAREERHRTALTELIEHEGRTPAILHIIAAHRKEAMDALFSAYLDQGGFEWSRDGAQLLERMNPAFAALYIYPTSFEPTGMLGRYAAGLPPIPPATRARRKARRRARRGK